MAKKVIKQTYQTNIDIESFTADNITISQHGTMTSDEVVIEKSKATEVAKAIDENYQKVEDERDYFQNLAGEIAIEENNLKQENAKLVEALDKLLEYGDKQVEIYRQSVEDIKSDQDKTEDVKIFQMRLSQGKFYGWRDSMKFLREALEQSKNIK